MTPLQPRPFAARLAAATAAGTLAAGAFALPASADSDYPFLHNNVALTEIAPGGTVEVSPAFVQEEALPADTAAVVISFTDSYNRVGMSLEGAEVNADYDNCIESSDEIRGGVVCAVTDFADDAGEQFTLSEGSPVTYSIAEDAAGPMDVCSCTYSVRPVDAETLEVIFGEVTWSDESGNLLAFRPYYDHSAPTSGSRNDGSITLYTADNPYDLAIEGANVEGGQGDEVTVTVPVTNNGPAAAYHRVDHWGTYEVRAQLPTGTELIGIDSEQDDAWGCFDQDSLEHTYELANDTNLDHFDLNCQFEGLEPGESIDFAFTVLITDAGPVADGLVEVSWTFSDDGSAEELDGDLANNVAPIGVNAGDGIAGGGEGTDGGAPGPAGGDDDASGKLPVTGTSMTIIIAAAAAALVAGAIMFVLVRRRRASADW